MVEQRALGADHPETALTLVYLSDAVRRIGRFKEAEQAAREALDIDTKRLGPDHPQSKGARGMLGMALAKQRRWAEAEPLLLAYGAALEAKTGVEGDLAEVTRQIAEMYEAWGKPDKAAEWRKKLRPEPRK